MGGSLKSLSVNIELKYELNSSAFSKGRNAAAPKKTLSGIEGDLRRADKCEYKSRG